MTLRGHHARKRERQELIAIKHEAEAMKHNELHSLFFNVPHVPVQEIRKNLDAKLTTYQLKSIYNEVEDEEDQEDIT